MSGFERTGKPNAILGDTAKRVDAPKVGTTLTHGEAKAAGYTGSVCDICGSARMRISGHCMVCEECGSTTGCS